MVLSECVPSFKHSNSKCCAAHFAHLGAAWEFSWAPPLLDLIQRSKLCTTTSPHRPLVHKQREGLLVAHATWSAIAALAALQIETRVCQSVIEAPSWVSWLSFHFWIAPVPWEIKMFEELATNCQSYSDGGVSVNEMPDVCLQFWENDHCLNTQHCRAMRPGCSLQSLWNYTCQCYF